MRERKPNPEEPLFALRARMHETLYTEALTMSVNKNLLDVTTLLEFAHGTQNVLEKARHIDSAIRVLQDVRAQLVHLGSPQ